MRQPAFDGAARGHHCLSDHLPAKYPLPTRLRAVAAKQVHLERFEVENGNEVDQSFGHRNTFNFPRHARVRQSLEIPPVGARKPEPLGSSVARNGHCWIIRPVSLRPDSPSYNEVA